MGISGKRQIEESELVLMKELKEVPLFRKEIIPQVKGSVYPYKELYACTPAHMQVRFL